MVRSLSRTRVDHRYLEAEFKAKGAVAELFYCTAPEVLLEGPAGTGKTRGALEYFNHLSVKYPGSRFLVARATRKSLTESALVTLENKVWGGFHPAMHGTAGRAHRHSYVWPWRSNVVDGKTYKGRTEWILGGLDNPDRIMSTEYDGALICEATECTIDQLEKVGTRLRNWVMPYQQLLCDCNPGPRNHPLNLRADLQMVRLLSRHEDNPSVDPLYLKRLSKLTGARRDRLWLGRWASEEGAVWPHWDEAKHMTVWSRLPRRNPTAAHPDGELNFTRYWGSIDWGFTAAGVFQVWACTSEGRAFRLHEIYQTKRNIDWWAAQIEQFCHMYPFETIVADPSRNDLIDKMNDHMGRYRGRNAPRLVTEADNDVKAGIEVVSTLLQPGPDGLPMVMLVRDGLVQADQELLDYAQPYCTEKEIDAYHYAPIEAGKFNRDEPERGQPDHGCDALRYALMWLWRKSTVLRTMEPAFEIGTYGEVLEHEKFLRQLRRRERVWGSDYRR